MAVIIIPLPASDAATTEHAQSLVDAVRGVLEAAILDNVQVRFGTWTDDDGLAFVCKVESWGHDPFHVESSWRWWSPIVRDGSELRRALETWLQDRPWRGERPQPVEMELAVAAAL